MKKKKLLSAVIAVLILPGAVLAETQPVKPSDLLKIRQLGSVNISPDGDRLVYTVQKIVDDDEDGYEYNTQLYLMDLEDPDDPMQLTYSESASQPEWHPDGEKLAFVRSVDGTPQIFVLSMKGGEAVMYTDEEHGASSPAWSPDGDRLMFTSGRDYFDLVEKYEQVPEWPLNIAGRSQQAHLENKESDPDPDGSLDEIRAWMHENAEKENPRVINRLNFLGETALQSNPSFSHIFVMDAEEKAEPEKVTEGFFSHSGAAWMPDGEHIVLHGNRDTERHPDRVQENKLYKLNPAEGVIEVLLERDDHSVFGAVPSPGGDNLAFLSSDQRDRGYAQTQIGIFDVDTGSWEIISEEIDRSMGVLNWHPSEHELFATTGTEGSFPIVRFDLNAGAYDMMFTDDEGIRSFDVHEDRLAYVYTEVANPFELYQSELDGSSSQRLTSHNYDWLQNRELSKPEQGIVESTDGYEVEYWLMKPTGFEEGESYPLMTQIHGGPSVMWGPGEASMWHEFQLMASRGYGVIYSNPRGSAGYGRDFQHGNHQDWGDGPGTDVINATKAAAGKDWVDDDRLVVTGGSYAGYLTAWIMTMDHPFQAAVAQRGVYDLSTFLGEGLAWRLVPDRFGGYPWEEEIGEILDEQSPITHVDQIDSPMLIIHGDLDLRTGVSQSEMLYKSLKIREQPVEYVRYPDAAHGLSRTGDPHQRIDRLLRIYEFMERYVR